MSNVPKMHLCQYCGSGEPSPIIVDGIRFTSQRGAAGQGTIIPILCFPFLASAASTCCGKLATNNNHINTITVHT